MATFGAYITSPLGLSKIATIAIGVVAFVTINEACGNSGHAGAATVAPYANHRLKRCGGSCPSSQQGCPEGNSVAKAWFIVLLSLIFSTAAAIALLVFFKPITEFAHTPKIDIAGHIIAVLLQVFAAYNCFDWVKQGNIKYPCTDEGQCKRERDEVINPTTFMVAGAMVAVMAIAYVVTVVFIAKSMMPAASSTGAAAAPAPATTTAA